MFKQIVVGVDEREGGRDAIALAKNLLAKGGELTLAHVNRHDGHGYRGPGAASEASGWASAAQLLEKVQEKPASTHISVGGFQVRLGAACTSFAN